jgi:uncharacterized membrane protein YjjP (DUF1212 family)
MVTDPIKLVVRAAALLHANGQTTQRVVSETTRLGEALGLNVQVLPQWDAIFVRYQRADADPASPWMEDVISVKPTGVDMNKVYRTTTWIDHQANRDGPITIEELTRLDQELKAITGLAPSSDIRFILMAGLGASALGLIFGVASLTTLTLIFGAAVLGALVRRLLGRMTDNLFIQPFAAALMAGLVGGIAQHLLEGAELQFVDIAPCMILVPGAHILNASLDMARGRIGLGWSRLTYCALILMSICTGLLLGLMLVDSSLAQGMVSAEVPLWLDIISAGVAVSAFGAFFSLPWRILIAPIIVGMVCHASRWWVLDLGQGVVLGAFVACLIAGTATALLARRLKLPFAALAFCAVVSMMPGIFVFKLASELISVYLAGDQATLAMLTSLFAHGTATFLIVMVMTFGLIFPKMLIDGWLGPDTCNHNK